MGQQKTNLKSEMSELNFLMNDEELSKISHDKQDLNSQTSMFNQSLISDNVYGFEKVQTPRHGLTKTMNPNTSMKSFRNPQNNSQLSKRGSEYSFQGSLDINKKWKWIIKFFQTVLSTLFKSSCLLSNILSQVMNSLSKKENKLLMKQLVMTFLKKSVERHEKSFQKVNSYKNIKAINLKGIISCMEVIRDIVLEENQIQEGFINGVKDSLKGK